MVPTFGPVSFDRWVQISAGFSIFAFFGMGKDAFKEYKRGMVMMRLDIVFPSLREGGRRERLRESTPSVESGTSRVRLFPRVRRFSNLFSRQIVLPQYTSSGVAQ